MGKDGIDNPSLTAVSNSPSAPSMRIKPSNFRRVIRSQIATITGSTMDEFSKFSFGGLDGRFVNNFPAKVEEMTDPFGREYHRVGLHTSSDLSVAAP